MEESSSSEGRGLGRELTACLANPGIGFDSQCLCKRSGHGRIC